MDQNKRIVTVQQDENGELFIELGEDIIQSVGWKVGDTVIWTDNHDGSWSLSKAEYVHEDQAEYVHED